MRIFPLFAALLLSLFASPARAELQIGFWSRELGTDLPHAFFTIRGTVNGQPVDESYGFTPKAVTPAMLWGPVPGRIDLTTKKYMAASNMLWTVTVPESDYAKLKDLVQRYSVKPGSIYRMNERNCVHFVAEAAGVVGLKLPDGKGLMKRPTSYLMAVANANRGAPSLVMVRRK